VIFNEQFLSVMVFDVAAAGLRHSRAPPDFWVRLGSLRVFLGLMALNGSKSGFIWVRFGFVF
jgi:hypothetical protein